MFDRHQYVFVVHKDDIHLYHVFILIKVVYRLRRRALESAQSRFTILVRNFRGKDARIGYQRQRHTTPDSWCCAKS